VILPQLRVLLLEDNSERVAEMGDVLAELAIDVTIRLSDNALDFIESLDQELPLADLVLLDHDLGPSRQVGGTRVDPGDGRDVVAALCARKPCCPVIIHSTNVPAAFSMESDLRSSGWNVSAIVPYCDLVWVREAWLPLVIKSLAERRTA
jgi:CheY-like chemotaxis protein